MSLACRLAGGKVAEICREQKQFRRGCPFQLRNSGYSAPPPLRENRRRRKQRGHPNIPVKTAGETFEGTKKDAGQSPAP
jgi:hypothetical protein